LREIVRAGYKGVNKSSIPQLYRSMLKEVPRVLTLYDIDMPVRDARYSIRFHFDKHKKLEDGRIIDRLLAMGYLEMEETLMQWKQKTHLLRLLEPPLDILKPQKE